jgi:hypothetical protein
MDGFRGSGHRLGPDDAWITQPPSLGGTSANRHSSRTDPHVMALVFGRLFQLIVDSRMAFRARRELLSLYHRDLLRMLNMVDHTVNSGRLASLPGHRHGEVSIEESISRHPKLIALVNASKRVSKTSGIFLLELSIVFFPIVRHGNPVPAAVAHRIRDNSDCTRLRISEMRNAREGNLVLKQSLTCLRPGKVRYENWLLIPFEVSNNLAVRRPQDRSGHFDRTQVGRHLFSEMPRIYYLINTPVTGDENPV